MTRNTSAAREKLRQLYREEITGYFDALLMPHINGTRRVLDAGCGEGDPVLHSLASAHTVIGCDVDAHGLGRNTQAAGRVLSRLENLPLAAASFDAIVCKYVVEHLETPARVFSEFHRVLRPGGVAAIMTPNRRSVFGAVTLLLPDHLKLRLKRYLRGREEEEVFPSFYRANTPGRLDAMMRTAGFKCLQLTPRGATWALFCRYPVLAHTMRALERAQARIPLLRACSSQIAGLWRKPDE